jgi:hypothetical protein
MVFVDTTAKTNASVVQTTTGAKPAGDVRASPAYFFEGDVLGRFLHGHCI